MNSASDSALKYRRATCHSSCCSASTAPTRRTTAAGLGKMPTTSVRRLTSLFNRSSGFNRSTGCDLEVFTGRDVLNLGPTKHPGTLPKNGNKIWRQVNLPGSQYVFFTLGNANVVSVPFDAKVSPSYVP